MRMREDEVWTVKGSNRDVLSGTIRKYGSLSDCGIHRSLKFSCEVEEEGGNGTP